MSIMSDAPTPPNSGKWELTYWTYDISFHLPPLGSVGASDMIGIGWNDKSLNLRKLPSELVHNQAVNSKNSENSIRILKGFSESLLEISSNSDWRHPMASEFLQPSSSAYFDLQNI